LAKSAELIGKKRLELLADTKKSKRVRMNVKRKGMRGSE
jgi:hypothetical protein